MLSQDAIVPPLKRSVSAAHGPSSKSSAQHKQPGNLEPLYDEIIRTAVFTVKPDNIATFLGQCITYNCKKEVGTNYNQRILGTRIKHHMGDVSIKMYDKFGHVLRIESTCNDIGSFRVKTESGAQRRQFIGTKSPIEKKHLQSVSIIYDHESR